MVKMVGLEIRVVFFKDIVRDLIVREKIFLEFFEKFLIL